MNLVTLRLLSEKIQTSLPTLLMTFWCEEGFEEEFFLEELSMAMKFSGYYCNLLSHMANTKQSLAQTQF